MDTSRFNMLPEDCVSTIISLTSPLDACRLMLASSSLRSAAESDIVWGRFLPSDLPNILSRSQTSTHLINFSCKKDLYFQLCNSILIDGGIRRFCLNKVSGKKCCVLSAIALNISLSNEPNHWTWTTHSTSRVSEVVELKTIYDIEIEGKINTEDLSSNTTYIAYLIIKVSDRSFGLDSIPCETSVSTDEYSVTNATYLCRLDDKKQHLEVLFFMNRRQMMEKRVVEGEGRRPINRKDGWMDIELGEFFVGQKGNLMEVKGRQLKGGLIIEGIESRLKC